MLWYSSKSIHESLKEQRDNKKIDEEKIKLNQNDKKIISEIILEMKKYTQFNFPVYIR